MSRFWGIWSNDYSYRAPAFWLEEQLGITGIGRRYTMPPDHNMQSLELEIRRRVQWADISMDERLRRARHYAKQLTRLNPELKQLKFNHRDLMQVWHALLGVTSGFNTQDINCFINNDDKTLYLAATGNQLKKTLLDAFNIAAPIYWNPSRHTGDLILQKIIRAGIRGHGPDLPRPAP